MTPIETYKDTAARARRMVNLHDGLINIRQRRIRRDWKTSFCKLMHWTNHVQIERVDSSDAVVVLRDGANLTPNDFSSDCLSDLLRSALVYGVSALDRYVHERVVKGIIATLKRSHRTKQQEDLAIPASTVIQIIETVARARKKGNAVRPANEVRKKVQELLHLRPFQSWREIDYAFQLLGIKDLASKVQTSMHIGNISTVKNPLNKIVARRNSIVHEGDIIKHQRGGKLRARGISPAFVVASLDFLDRLVEHLEAVN